jgi:signal transduction histidine kinase
MFDVAVGAVGFALAVIATWVPSVTVGTPVAGPTWLRVLFPLGLALPLLARRSRPLPTLSVVLATVALQALVTRDTPEGLEMIFCVGVAMYSVAAYGERIPAVTGLVLGAATYGIYAGWNVDVRSGRHSDAWAGAFFGVALVTIWLVGVYVRYRRGEEAAAATAAESERQAREAVVEERARIARELHDVISHNLSVVVVQAAGARATGGHDPATLEKIERSGRDSLTEMRRLLGVLRSADDSPDLLPQPGLALLEDLVASFREAGVSVGLSMLGDQESVPSAVQLSAYRIVQESLTNVLKHAREASAHVTVRVEHSHVSLDVVDDGHGACAVETGGHGLLGMRERVALFGGQLETGAVPGGGFRVHASLPMPVGEP